VSAIPHRRPPAPSSARFPGMRVCLRPAECPYAAGDSATPAPDLGRWERALSATLPGDRALVSALIGDITVLARSAH
jgi:hypothetical protein